MISEEMRKKLEATALAIINLDDEKRAYLWDRLKESDKLCLSCGEITEAQQCWSCYESRNE